jgi:hypothetical protein
MPAVVALELLCIAPAGLAAPAPIALVSPSPTLAGLKACLAKRAVDSGPVVRADTLVSGFEFRMALRNESGASPLLVIQALIRPDMSSLLQSHHHDDDPEAQPEATARVLGLLRIPVGTRAWVWRAARQALICAEAADWLTRLRSRPVLLDRLGPDGEPP